jgi:CubicO group peptidase (beta-lactamase class C family)
MSNGLPRSDPSSAGVDPAAVTAFLDAVEADQEVELHSLMVVRHEHVVAEGWWAPYTPDRPRLLYSLSKSFTSTALGFALAEGLLDLDDTVVSHFPELADQVSDRRSRSVTLRHLATMSSGHTRDMWAEAVAHDPDEPVRGFLMVPPDEEPGTVFTYSQPCTYVLASVIQRRAGQSLTQYLRPRLFDPLGIGAVGWESWPPGGPDIGFSGLFARTEDVAKLGLLYLQGGRWYGEQLLPESYVSQATSRQIGTPNEGSDNWTRGYGFQFWMSAHGYRGDGAFGQFCVVLPEQDAVVAITAGTPAMPNVLDHVWHHLLPGLGDGPLSGGVSAALEERLRSLALAPCAASSRRPLTEGWTAAPFPVVSGSPTSGEAPFTSVVLDEVDGRLVVTLVEPGNALSFPVGADDWLTSSPLDRAGDEVAVAASGGWRDDQTLRVEVVFLETPHRLDITCSRAGHSATARWRAGPAHGSTLRSLHRPRARAR